jgi:2-polyprenyl-3-methyl-5-hydroxy-6-metoxy-1,4-benzoquinol methylase
LTAVWKSALVSGCAHRSDELAHLFVARDYITQDEFGICLCSACGLTVTIPTATAQLAKYYPTSYYGIESRGRRFPGAVEWLQAVLYQWRARSVELLLRRKGRVLDIGCGPGALLHEFRKRGWQVHGTELSEDAAWYAREVLQLPVEVAPMNILPWAEGTFDAVVLFHVLEHIPDPAGLLREVSRVLQSRGVLLVSVPNFGSVEAQLATKNWFHLDVPRHLTHFTKATLERALVETGFCIGSRSFFAPEFDGFSFTQSALNCLPLQPNLLYNLLRRRGAKLMGKDTGRLQIILTLLLAVPLAILSVPATLLAGIAHRGATMTFWAVKEN